MAKINKKNKQKKETSEGLKNKKNGENKIKAEKELAKSFSENFENKEKSIGVRVIGIGGGGGNIVAELSQTLSIFPEKKVDFYAANTDVQALNLLPSKVKKIPLGDNLTQGLGTGRNPSLGEEAAKKSSEQIKKLFPPEKDFIIFISCLGGGTGSGATPVFTKIVRDLSPKVTTLGIFTLPFTFEGKEKRRLARESLLKMKDNLNAVIVIPNDKILKIIKPNTSFTTALSILNKKIAKNLEGLLRAIYLPGLINIDWADIRATLSGFGNIAYLNVAQSQSKENLDNFIKNLLFSPIYDYDFSGAENVLFNIESSKNITFDQLSTISQKINSLAPRAKIIFGLYQSQKLKDLVCSTILACGVQKEKKEIKIKKNEEKKSERKVKKIINKKEEKQKTGEEKPKEEPKIEIRRNALEAKKVENEKQQEEDEKEKIFDIPAFLRKPGDKK